MCADEKIPPVNRLGRLQDNLETLEQTSSAGQDIFALERPYGTADEVIESFNIVTNNMDVSRLREEMLNQGRRRMSYELPEDYENIFEHAAFSRRAERPVPPDGHEPDCFDAPGLMWEWVAMCREDLSFRAEQHVPGDMEPFEHLMVNHMPARLDFSTWIGTTMMAMATQEITDYIQEPGEVREWQDWMTDNEILYRRLPSGLYQDVIYFVGEARPGRLVWIPAQRFDLPFGHGRFFCREIRAMLREAEVALIALARRIARHIANCIVYQYAMPEAERRGHSILNRKQIGGAVREILGDTWFDLPIDLDVSLRNWSEDDVLKPDNEMRGWNVFLDEDED